MNLRRILLVMALLGLGLFSFNQLFGAGSGTGQGNTYELIVEHGPTLRTQESDELSFFHDYAAIMRFSEIKLNPIATEKNKVKIGDTIILNLFGDKKYSAVVDRLNINVNNTYSIRARLDDYAMGSLIMNTTGNMSLGIVDIPETGEQFEILSSPEGKTCYVMEIDQRKRDYLDPAPPAIPENITKEDIRQQKRIKKILDSKRDGDDNDDDDDELGPEDSAIFGMMIIYTENARKWAVNNGGIDNIIAYAMEDGQIALDNSKTGVTIELVYSSKVDYPESGNPYADLYRLTASPTWNPFGETFTISGREYDIPGYMDEVHEWRREYGADLIGFFATMSGVGGLGWLLMDINGMPNYAMNIDRIEQIKGSHTFIHEVGHNVGMHHHAEQNVQAGPTVWDNWEENTWSAGWRWNKGGQYWCSIMTYESATYWDDGRGGNRAPYFSSPLLLDDTIPMGHPLLADNVRTLVTVKHTVAAYSESVALEGYVYESGSQLPVSGALIEVEGINVTTTTDEDGYFCYISLLEEPQKLTVSRIGYYDEVIEDLLILQGLTTNIDVYIDKHPNISLLGEIYGSDKPEEGIKDAELSLVGYDEFYTTSSSSGKFIIPGVFNGHLYKLTIEAEGYVDHIDYITIAEDDEDIDLGRIRMIEVAYPVYQVELEEGEDDVVELTWEAPIAKYSQFRHDSGIVEKSFGIASGNEDSVFGSAYHTPAQINEISWYLTSDGGPHETVKVVIFGLNEDGMPDSSQLLYEKSEIENRDDNWNYHRLPYAIGAPNGFLVGVCYTGNIGIAIDSGTDEEYPFAEGCNYINLDYKNSIWRDISMAGFPNNYLIRANGYDLYEEETHDVRFERALTNYVVYRMLEGEEENKENWVELGKSDLLMFVDTTLKAATTGEYRYGVVAEYDNDVYSTAVLSKTIEHIKMIPDAPVNLSYDLLDYGYVKLEWEPANEEELEIDGYNIYRDNEKLNENIVTQLTYTDTETENGVSYIYYVCAVKDGEESEPSERVEVIITNVAKEIELPVVTKLENNYPNPFNPETTIDYSLADDQFVKLEIYDIKGRLVKTLINDSQSKGKHSIVWKGIDNKGNQVGSGIYLYRISAGSYSSTKKMILMK